MPMAVTVSETNNRMTSMRFNIGYFLHLVQPDADCSLYFKAPDNAAPAPIRAFSAMVRQPEIWTCCTFFLGQVRRARKGLWLSSFRILPWVTVQTLQFAPCADRQVGP